MFKLDFRDMNTCFKVCLQLKTFLKQLNHFQNKIAMYWKIWWKWKRLWSGGRGFKRKDVLIKKDIFKMAFGFGIYCSWTGRRESVIAGNLNSFVCLAKGFWWKWKLRLNWELSNVHLVNAETSFTNLKSSFEEQIIFWGDKNKISKLFYRVMFQVGSFKMKSIK